MKQKYKILSLCTLFIIFFLTYIYVKNFMVGTKLWGQFTEHELIEIKDINSVEKYNNHYEENFFGFSDSPAMCRISPGCDYNDLFGDDLGFIFSGTIIQYDNYVFSDALDGKHDGKHDLNFACHTIKIHVNKDIYGNLKENQDVYIFCRWLYIPDEETDKGNQISEGKKGIFITSGKPVMLKKEKGGSIYAIGSMHKLIDHGKHYCLTDSVDGLDNLETKQDVIDFWEKQHWIYY